MKIAVFGNLRQSIELAKKLLLIGLEAQVYVPQKSKLQELLLVTLNRPFLKEYKSLGGKVVFTSKNKHRQLSEKVIFEFKNDINLLSDFSQKFKRISWIYNTDNQAIKKVVKKNHFIVYKINTHQLIRDQAYNTSVNFYLDDIEKSINSMNKERSSQNVCDVNIEFAHLNLRLLKKLGDEEIENLLKIETERLNQYISKAKLLDKSITKTVLIDDKEPISTVFLERLYNHLKSIGVDFVVKESSLCNYLPELENIIPESVYREFINYFTSHKKLGCSQDIFIWHCIRLGIINFESHKDIVIPLSDRAVNGNNHFVAKTLVSILSHRYKPFEDRAEKYFTQCFDFSVVTAIRKQFY